MPLFAVVPFAFTFSLEENAVDGGFACTTRTLLSSCSCPVNSISILCSSSAAHNRAPAIQSILNYCPLYTSGAFAAALMAIPLTQILMLTPPPLL
mmetsp:Transcript_11970/g.21751  ORF Transcript_11970/g.21751 Transcript_11970/m.21751 type:complete len:95 (-) Transcript_11970:63-347(-)